MLVFILLKITNNTQKSSGVNEHHKLASVQNVCNEEITNHLLELKESTICHLHRTPKWILRI